jgi:hypothetical protein
MAQFEIHKASELKTTRRRSRFCSCTTISVVCITLRVTLAMEAGIANHVWNIEELVGLL